MNYNLAKPSATPGEAWRDDDGFVAVGRGDDYNTLADCDCSDADIDEREANKMLIIHHWNNFDKALAAIRDAVSALQYHEHYGDATSLAAVLEELETVDI